MRLFVSSVALSVLSAVSFNSNLSAQSPVADAQVMDRCEDASDPSAQLEACDAAIASGALAKADLASAYAKKGFAEEKLKGDQAASASFQKAIALFGELIDSKPRDANALLNRANLYFEVGDLAHAITDYSAYLKLEPNNAQALHQRALCYNSLKDYRKVIADETEAIRLRADKSFFYVVRGEAYDGLNETQKALADYNRALNINPNNWAGLSDRARLYRRMGDYAHSVADDTQFISLQLPWAPSGYTHRGETYILLGEYPLAIVDFDAAIAPIRTTPKLATRHAGRERLIFAPSWMLPASIATKPSKLILKNRGISTAAGWLDWNKSGSKRHGPIMTRPSRQTRPRPVTGTGERWPRSRWAERLRHRRMPPKPKLSTRRSSKFSLLLALTRNPFIKPTG